MPTALKKVTGNRARRPLNENEPQPLLGDSPPEPPEYLDEDAAAEWRRLARQLWLNGLLGLEDHGIFSGYCEAFSDWMRYNRMILAQERAARQTAAAAEAFDGPDASVLLSEFDGRIVGTSNGNLIQSPIIGLRNTARRDCLRFASELGLTPSSRSKVSVPRAALAPAAPKPAKGPEKRPSDFLNRGPRLAVDNA